MTLLEVIIAMFILVMVFGAALSSVVQVSRIVAAAKNRTRAVAILNMQMEEMRSMSFAKLTEKLTKDSKFLGGDFTAPALTGKSVQKFDWARTMDASGDGTSADMMKVVITVKWSDAGVERAIRSYSYFAKNGVLTADSTPAAS